MWCCGRVGFFFKMACAPVARGMFSLLVKRLALRAGAPAAWGSFFFWSSGLRSARARGRAGFSLSWFSRWWRGADFILSVKRLALRAGQRQGGVFRLPPPYLWTPLSPQRVKGCSPLIRASRASKVAGAFLVLFWHAKENLALPQQRFTPRNKRAIALFLPRESKSPRTAHSAGAVKLQIIESALSSASCERSSQSSRPDGPHGAGREPCKPCRKLRR